ncbi:MAG: NADH:ubiquinone reductase (Na(+)-transporting) subunit C [Sphingomonadales bacterium]|nr:NADH:ubiquinone reductase (Na(+)-transporting) subunit C [Sphingomonadales bacterium]
MLNSNTYVFGFAFAVTIIVALMLSGAATILKPFQEQNFLKEKQENILSVVGKTATDDYKKFNTYIKSVVIDEHGNELTGVDAFDINLAYDKKLHTKDSTYTLRYPLYIFEEGGKKTFILQLAGVGLWGPIWGYLALDEDGNTVKKAVFDHKGETPGLGAEINTDGFEGQFRNRKIFDDSGSFVSVQVTKEAKSDDDPHKVDAISGGTITSTGVSNMLREDIKFYLTYINKSKKV